MLIGGSSAFNLDMLDIRFAVVAFCSRLSKAKGFAGKVILEVVGVTSTVVGIIVDNIVVDGGKAAIAFRLVVVDGNTGHADDEDVELEEDNDNVLDGIALTLGNSLRLMSTKSSYRLCEKESVSFPGKSRKLPDEASGTGGGMDAVNWNRLSAFVK